MHVKGVVNEVVTTSPYVPFFTISVLFLTPNQLLLSHLSCVSLSLYLSLLSLLYHISFCSFVHKNMRSQQIFHSTNQISAETNNPNAETNQISHSIFSSSLPLFYFHL